MRNKSLDTLALLHGTDKASNDHNYTELYERYFTDLPSAGALLELGWGGHEDPAAGGASARMWRDWLGTRWRIGIIDNEQKAVTDADAGIGLYLGDQADIELAQRISTDLGRDGFDVVVDDASHLSSKTIASFWALWDLVRPGGWYVIEDTHASYHDFYYGSGEANENPSVGGYDQPGLVDTTMGFLKRVADEVNYHGAGEWDLFPGGHSMFSDVAEVHFHFNIAFIRKAS